MNVTFIHKLPYLCWLQKTIKANREKIENLKKQDNYVEADELEKETLRYESYYLEAFGMMATNLSQYKDSMNSLIRADADELKNLIEENKTKVDSDIKYFCSADERLANPRLHW